MTPYQNLANSIMLAVEKLEHMAMAACGTWPTETTGKELLEKLSEIDEELWQWIDYLEEAAKPCS